jgi:hypothetical protein
MVGVVNQFKRSRVSSLVHVMYCDVEIRGGRREDGEEWGKVIADREFF